MPGRTSSSPSALHKDSATAARNHTSKLKSWFTNLYPRASASHPLRPSRQSSHVQTYSKLLSTLPLEIRHQIYAYILHSYGTIQHILLTNGKLTHVRCALPTSHSYFQTLRARNNDCDIYDISYRNSLKDAWEVIPLLLSCRQIYLEFIEVLYSSTIFRLHINAAIQFIGRVPAPYIALAYLHLSYDLESPMYLPAHAWPVNLPASDPKADEARWETFWCALARLRVHVLIVEIIDMGVRAPEQALLEPLRRVRAEKFEIILPWPYGLETSVEFKDVGFVVRRPPESVGTDLMISWDVAKAYPGMVRQRGLWERLRNR